MVLAAAATTLVLTPAANAACRTIRFQPGASSAEIRGEAPAEGTECLRFGTGQGQTVQLSVKSPRDQVAFTTDGLVDNRDKYTFVSEKKNYDLLMHQAFKAVAPVKYVLTLSIR
ncbi:MAG: hypothetical protein EOP82_29050 [Variovorax sp.]|nr:MAG: hypothetical protein EOP82_29050 [Variovorax sp.]